MHPQHPIEKLIQWIGSPASLLLHSFAFLAFFLLSIFGLVPWALMLLILTTIVSLEAIYLAIFIQMTVNRQAASLKEVEEDIGEIQEDVEEMSEDVEDLQVNLEDLQEDLGDMADGEENVV